MIKVCVNPQCQEVAHNISVKETRCRNCGFIMVKINEKTYLNKFAGHYFQYDYSTGELVNAAMMGFDHQLELEAIS
jgi:hypothetical protein